MAKQTCWHREPVTASQQTQSGTVRGIKTSAPCARTLDKEGKCPKHGTDVK